MCVHLAKPCYDPTNNPADLSLRDCREGGAAGAALVVFQTTERLLHD